MKLNDKLSVLFLLEGSKICSDGKMPIYVRITVVGSPRAEMSLGRKVYPHEWDQENERVIVNSKNKELAIINTIIQKYKVKLETDFFILDSQFKIVSSQMLKRRFLDLDEKEKKTNKRLTSICFQIFELNVVKSAHNSLSVRQCKCEQNNFVKHPDVSGQGQLFMYIKSLV